MDGAVERFVAEYAAAAEPDKGMVMQKARIALDTGQYQEFLRRTRESATRTRGVGLSREPGPGNHVFDRDGDKWRRHGDGGWVPVVTGPRQPMPLTWEKLNEAYGPLFRSK